MCFTDQQQAVDGQENAWLVARTNVTVARRQRRLENTVEMRWYL